MGYKDILEIAASWAALFTAAVAIFGYSAYRFERCQKRRRLEAYLRAEKASGKDKGQRTLMHLMAHLGMTESDILGSAFRSKHVQRTVDVKDGKAVGLFLEYKT